jgi:hypothetical protein
LRYAAIRSVTGRILVARLAQRNAKTMSFHVAAAAARENRGDIE